MEELNIEIVQMLKYEYEKTRKGSKFPMGFFFYINGEGKGAVLFHSQTRWEHTLDELPWEEREPIVRTLIEKLEEDGEVDLAKAFQRELLEYEEMTVYDKYQELLSRLPEMEREEVSRLYCQYETELEESLKTSAASQTPDFLLMELLEILKNRIADLAIGEYKAHCEKSIHKQ